jgi:transcriptional regulator with GAF, ATPase, and Fis domain
MAEAEEGLNEALRSLTGLLELPTGAFEAMASLAARAVPGCDGASVSVLEADGAVTTAGASDQRTMQLDDLQYDNDEGPCLSAIRTAIVVQVDDFSHDSRYSRFAPAAAALGVSSCLSVPLSRSAQTIGGLNLYGEKVHAYDDAAGATGEQVAIEASLLVATRRAHQQSLNLVDTLHATMASRAVIEQAKGIVMAGSHCDADHAFDILRRASQRQNVKLRDIAQTIVANTSS